MSSLDEVDVHDIRTDVYSNSSGCCVSVLHVGSGIRCSSEWQKSQLMAKAEAISMLTARLRQRYLDPHRENCALAEASHELAFYSTE